MAGPLAQLVRAKHPGAYDDLDDAQLEAAVVAKFPGVYDDLLAPKPPVPSRPVSPVVRPDAPWLTRAISGAGEAVIDAGKGALAGAASTVLHGGDLIRRGLGMDRVIETPQAQAWMTPPDSAAGKVGFYGEQAAEFAVPLTRLAKVTKGLSLPRRMAVDAAASAGVAGVQSGGDANATTTGAVLGGALPLAGAGLRLVGGAVSRGAAGAAEGGLGGAVAGALRTVAPVGSRMMLFQGLKPRNSRVNFMGSLDRAMPELKITEEALGRPIAGIDDLLEATSLAKKRVRAEYDEIAGPKRAMGSTVDLSSVADSMVRSIPSKLKLENPAQAKALTEAAQTYRRAFSLEEAEQLLKETNAELESFYNKFPQGQRKALVADPEAARLDAQAKGLRDAIYRVLDGPGQPPAARELNRRYGALLDIEDTAIRRANVTKRQQPESLSEQISGARAAGEMAKGAYKLLRGDLMGAADIAGARAQREAARFMKEQQTTDALIRRAFAGVKERPSAVPRPPIRPIRGLLERGAIPMQSGPDGSFVRSVPAQPAQTMRKALPPSRVREAGPGPDPSGPIPPTLPQNYLDDTPDLGLPVSKAIPPQEERSFMLRWLRSDLEDMPFQKGGSTKAQRDEHFENWRPGDEGSPNFVPAGRAAGTPTQAMFHAMGIRGSRAEIADKLSRVVRGEKVKGQPKLEALADAMREAWDGERLDWQLVSDETIAKLGIRRHELQSPVSIPSDADMPEVHARFFKPVEW